MNAEFFVLILGLFCAALLAWGFRSLPGERWQILAAVPVLKDGDGCWRGVNITWYGVLSATAYVIGVGLLVILTGALQVPVLLTMSLVAAVLAVCVPAARIVARIVEKKPCTFTVAGAFFVAVLLVPPVIGLANLSVGAWLGSQAPLLPVMAAMAVAYAFGEGLGRLACISFGCCYGRRLEDSPAWLRRLFARWSFIFQGDTKKIAYASGLEGTRVLPVQGMTAVLYVGIGLVSTLLFLESRYLAAFLTAMVVTQLWRAVSEYLRADHRGQGRVSVYQWMALFSMIYAAAVGLASDGAGQPLASLEAGLGVFWQPGMLIFLQTLWLVIFIHTGRSMVTEASVSFRVCRHKI